MKRFILLCVVYATVNALPIFTYASESDGTIDTQNRYAWSENAGWIDFGTSAGNVHVTSTSLTGYAYSENTGWISLNCSNTNSCADNSYSVGNTSEGVLSGYAWSENAGWIHFAPTGGGVTISASGVFSGYAYSETMGWISFAGDNPVTTDWRKTTTPTTSDSAVVSTVQRTKGGSAQRRSVNLNAPTSIQPTVKQPTLRLVITKDLKKGARGIEISMLQEYLNNKGYVVSVEGEGSPGKETTYFGSLTQAALARFQEAHNIYPAAGYFGPKTRAYISSNP